jgi:hypothetical protein
VSRPLSTRLHYAEMTVSLHAIAVHFR